MMQMKCIEVDMPRYTESQRFFCVIPPKQAGKAHEILFQIGGVAFKTSL